MLTQHLHPQSAKNSSVDVLSQPGICTTNHIRLGKRVYWPELDGLRTIAFLCVFMCHFGPPPEASLSNFPLLNGILAAVTNKLYVGLDMLFVLSGFLITGLLLDERKRTATVNLSKFFARRALRILPLYYGVISFVALVPLLTLTHSSAPLLASYFKRIILPASGFMANFAFIKHHAIVEQVSATSGVFLSALLFPLWSLCVEEHFYTLWAPTFKRVASLSFLKIVCACLILASVAFKIHIWNDTHTSPDWMVMYKYFYNSFCRMDGLMIGSLIAIYMSEHGTRIKRFVSDKQLWCFAVLTGLSYWLCACVAGISSNNLWFLLSTIVVPWALGLLLLTVICTDSLKKCLSVKLLTRPAKFTYAAYLVHYFVMCTVSDWLAKNFFYTRTMFCYVLGFSLSLALTVLFAMISWIVLEQPLARLRTKYAS